MVRCMLKCYFSHYRGAGERNMKLFQGIEGPGATSYRDELSCY